MTDQESELGFMLGDVESLLPLLEEATPQRSSTGLLLMTSTSSDTSMMDFELSTEPLIGTDLIDTTKTLTPKWLTKKMETIQRCEHASCAMIRIGLGWFDPGEEPTWESMATGDTGRAPTTEWIKEPQEACECGS